jgi:glycosyltransferase involved in cell wall biosynthesis
MNKPLVSIIAASYNHAAFVVETLDSIRLQTYENIELIITDDGSKDDSVAIIKEWILQHDLSCTFIVNEKNEGICKTFNKGLESCKGEYFQVIACDDVMVGHKIEKQVHFMEASTDDLAMVYTDAIIIDKSSQVMAELFSNYKKIKQELYKNNDFERLIQRNHIIAPSCLIRKSAMDAIGGRYDESLSYEDWDLWLRLADKFKLLELKEPLVKYRRLDGSVSHNVKYEIMMAEDSIRLLDKHRGISKEIDTMIDESQRVHIEILINNNKATRKHLWGKLRHEKTVYSLFLFLCISVGIDQNKAHSIKSKLKS